MNENNQPADECNVTNFQIQYFSITAKNKLDAMADRHKLSRKQLFQLIADNAEVIEEFMVKKNIMPKI